ncbi:MAG TPA: 4Fe-4S dicluster domain-containing protein [Nitrospiria bacterium]|nr:4Fe-4S dicluster domain-containing protein [Nitrospiria bacterium]
MYLVANIDPAICGATSCTLCTQFCPEANTIQYDKVRKTAFVAVDRCKGCAQCVWVCDNMAKHNAIKMIMIDQLPEEFTNKVTKNMSYEQEDLKPSPINK